MKLTLPMSVPDFMDETKVPTFIRVIILRSTIYAASSSDDAFVCREI